MPQATASNKKSTGKASRTDALITPDQGGPNGNGPQFAVLTALSIEEIRNRQRMEGNFDCYGRASSGYCDQFGCSYYTDCMNISHTFPNL